MAKKKNKKNKKARKEQQKRIQNMSAGQLLEKGQAALSNEKYRDAIDLLKLALKQPDADTSVKNALFRAYLLREKQLREKGLVQEADMVRKQANTHLTSFELLSESDLSAYLQHSDTQNAFNAYDQYLNAHDPSQSIEGILANRIVSDDCWEMLDRLKQPVPLKRDGGLIKSSLPLMNDANWADALTMLKKIPRSSPYAPLRLFCRAMVAFANENDPDMQKAVNAIPTHFILKPIADAMLANGNGNTPVTIKRCLWDGPATTEQAISKLIEAIERHQYKHIAPLVSQIAEALFPENSEEAKFSLLICLIRSFMDKHIPEEFYLRIVKAVLKQPAADLMLNKLEFLTTSDDPITKASKYIELLEREFPDKKQRDIAHSLILYRAVKDIVHENEIERWQNGRYKTYKKLLGIVDDRKDDEDCRLLEIAAKGISLDPTNRKWYALVTDIPRASRPAKNHVEKLLEEMVEQFADDPYPCLELATVYYEKNAYRKAEKILAEALRRAPHDDRVVNRHAIALLVSAEKNVKRGNDALAQTDIKKAIALDRKAVQPFIRAKCIKWGAGDDPKQFGKWLKKELADTSLFELLTILITLYLDVKGSDLHIRHAFEQEIYNQLKKALASAKKLTSSEIVRLLLPFHKDFLSLVPHVRPAMEIIRTYPKILRRLTDQDLLSVLDIIIDPGLYHQLIKEFGRRTGSAKGNARLIFEFYMITLQHLDGKKMDSERFENILEKADASLEEQLRIIARKLAKQASGPLKMALEKFDFDILSESEELARSLFDIFNSPDPDSEVRRKMLDILMDLPAPAPFADTDSDDDLDDDGPEAMIRDVEEIVDEEGMRGASLNALKVLRKELQRDMPFFSMLCDLIARSNHKFNMSREVKFLITGKL